MHDRANHIGKTIKNISTILQIKFSKRFVLLKNI